MTTSAPSKFLQYNLEARERLISRLVSKELGLAPDTENHQLACRFTSDNLGYNRHPDTDPPSVESHLSSLEHRFFMNAQLEKGAAYGALVRFFLALDLRSAQLEANHRILALLLHLSGRPMDSAYEPSPHVADLMTRLASQVAAPSANTLAPLGDPSTQPAPPIPSSDLERELALCHMDPDSGSDPDGSDSDGDDQPAVPVQRRAGTARVPHVPPPDVPSILLMPKDTPDLRRDGGMFGMFGDAYGPDEEGGPPEDGGFEAMRRALLSQLDPESVTVEALPTRPLHAPSDSFLPPYIPTESEPTSGPPGESDPEPEPPTYYDRAEEWSLPADMLGASHLTFDLTDSGPTLSDLLVAARAPHLAPMLLQAHATCVPEATLARALLTAAKGLPSPGLVVWSAADDAYRADPRVSSPRLSPGLVRALLEDAAAQGTRRRRLDTFLRNQLQLQGAGDTLQGGPVVTAFCAAACEMLRAIDLEVESFLSAAASALSVLQTREDLAPSLATLDLLASLSDSILTLRNSESDASAVSARFLDLLANRAEACRTRLSRPPPESSTSGWPPAAVSPESTLDFPSDDYDPQDNGWRVTEDSFRRWEKERQGRRGSLEARRLCQTLLLLTDCLGPFLDALTIWVQTGSLPPMFSVAGAAPMTTLPLASLPAFLAPLHPLLNDAGRASTWRQIHLGPKDVAPAALPADVSLSAGFLARFLALLGPAEGEDEAGPGAPSRAEGVQPSSFFPIDFRLPALAPLEMHLPAELEERFPETMRVAQGINDHDAAASFSGRSAVEDLAGRLAFLDELTAAPAAFSAQGPGALSTALDAAASAPRNALGRRLRAAAATGALASLPPVCTALLPHCLHEPLTLQLTEFNRSTLRSLVHARDGLSDVAAYVTLRCCAHPALGDVPGRFLTAVMLACGRVPPTHELATILRDALQLNDRERGAGCSVDPMLQLPPSAHAHCEIDVAAAAALEGAGDADDPMAAFDCIRFRSRESARLQLLLPAGFSAAFDRVTAMVLRVKAAKTALEKVRKWGWIFRRNGGRDEDEDDASDADTLSSSGTSDANLLRTNSAGARAAPPSSSLSLAARQQRWRDKQMAWGHVEASDALEQELTCFVHALHQFLLGHVLPVGWTALQSALEHCASLSEVQRELTQYAASIARQSFAAAAGLEGGWGLLAPHIRRVLGTAVRFAQWKGALLGPRRGRGPAAAAGRGPEAAAALQAMTATVRAEMSFLLRVLRMRAEVAGTEGDALRVLLGALNASGFYVALSGEIRVRN